VRPTINKTKMPNTKDFHPPHIYQDGSLYFIAAKTIEGERYFNSDDKKNMLLEVLKKASKKFGILLYAWVILDNHYHLLFELSEGKDLWKFIKNINDNSSRILNEFDGRKGRSVWYQYWDYCIRNEKDFFLHFNYIHHNPVKHKYVSSQDEVLDYKFCSYGRWVEKKGGEWTADCFERYPIKDFTVEGD